jgi:hypothetical protein
MALGVNAMSEAHSKSFERKSKQFYAAGWFYRLSMAATISLLLRVATLTALPKEASIGGIEPPREKSLLR